MAVKDHLDLIAPIVDTQPAYNLLAIVRKRMGTPESPELYAREHVAFARFKLKEAIREMRQAADFLEKEIGK